LSHLVKIKHQIQLTHVLEKGIQDFHKEMNGFQIREFVVVGVDAKTKEKTGVPTVNYLVISKLD
jgi:hypothetical protein